MTFEERFEELAPLAYRTAFRVVGRRSEAEEIAQETMARAMQRWSRIRTHARPWVCRVAANEAIGVVRKRNRRDRIVATHRPEPQPDDVSSSIGRLDLQRVLLDLPTRQREVVMLRFVADLTEREVADELGISLGTVKTHARRGLDALRSAMTDPSDERAVSARPADTPTHVSPTETALTEKE